MKGIGDYIMTKDVIDKNVGRIKMKNNKKDLIPILIISGALVIGMFFLGLRIFGVEEVELTEKQLEMMEIEGLSTDYESLSATEQGMVREAGKMFDYLEKKYHKEFVYDGFAEKLYTYRMVAHPVDNEDVKVTVEKQLHNYTPPYEDNYMEKASKELFEKYLNELILPLLKGHKVKIYPTITNVEENFLKAPTKYSDLDGNIYSNNDIFIDGEYFRDKELKEFEKQLDKVMREHKMDSYFNIFCLKKGEIDKMTDKNYEDFRFEEKRYIRENIDISLDKSIE